jgi:sugar O-acyltransferase (sialic acid O-acetyltransferase NeuD family)
MKLALFGYGGHAHEVAFQINKPIEFFVDDAYSNEYTKPISLFDPKVYSIMIAVADSIERKKVVERLPNSTKYFTFIHPTALIMDKNVAIGDGSFIGAYSIITTNAKIGKHSILNRGNHIGHDTLIGDFFSAMPGAIVSGNVTIGDRVYMGTHSSIRQKTKVCDDVIIGLNAGVVKNITESGVYVGTPAIKINKP